MKIIKAIILFFVFFSTTGYGYDVKKFEIPNGSVYQISMRQGEVALVNDDNFYIVINDIADYRCPPGMMCYWDGPFVVKGVFVSGDSKQFELTYDKQPLNIFNELGYSASIIDVAYENDLFLIQLHVK